MNYDPIEGSHDEVEHFIDKIKRGVDQHIISLKNMTQEAKGMNAPREALFDLIHRAAMDAIKTNKLEPDQYIMALLARELDL